MRLCGPARMALEYRYEFSSDVVVDLIGFRRHGHSEVDDPTITQPILYRKIKDHPMLYEIYAKNVGLDSKPYVEKFQAELDAAEKAGKSMVKKPTMRQMPSYWAPYHGGPYNPADEVDTGLTAAQLRDITDSLVTYPDDFHIHPKVQKLLEQRREMGYGRRPLDFGMAEALALGSLALEGVPIRISGQDSRRGTFNQRHSVLIDVIDEKEYVPLCHLSPGQARVEIYNSELSEAAVMGFEYGFARDYPEALVAWEAQFGDFANGAQIIIDQFIAAGEDKWDLLSGLVLLLPHGHEGQGPEHSSARIERYLQLCARDNMQVCQPSTAGQYFHLLRRQAHAEMAQAAHLLHAEEHVAASGSTIAAVRVGAATLSKRHSGRNRAGCETGSALHRQDRPGTAHGAQQAEDVRSGDRLAGADLSVPGDRGEAGPGSLPQCLGVHLGAGRAGQYGRAFLRNAAAEANSGLQGAQHQARC